MINKFLRSILFYTIFLFICLSTCFSVNIARKVSEGKEDWRLLNQAQNAFDKNDFGTALSFAEDAKKSRNQENEWKLYILDTSLKNNHGINFSDSITENLELLKSRSSTTAITIINKELERKGINFFNNSIIKLTEFIADYKYPEADYLIGQIYQLEGEFDLSKQFMDNALKYSFILDIPEEKYDILYDLASISEQKNDYESYETYLLSIVKDDKNFMDKSLFLSSIMRMIKLDDEKNVNKFFNLYRSENRYFIEAYEKLAILYELNEHTEKALECSAMGAITAFTTIILTLQNRKNNYKYINFRQTLYDCKEYEDIIEWGKNNKSWEIFYLFAKNCSSQGYLLFARKLYLDLANATPDEYWRIQAEKSIIK